jgi:hypothetical protein
MHGGLDMRSIRFKYITFSVVLVFSLFVTLTAFPFLHDHELDGEDHGDCKACQWIETGCTEALLFAFVAILFLVLLISLISAVKIACQPIVLSRIRAPPVHITSYSH